MRNVITTRLGFIGRNNVPAYKLNPREARMLKALLEYDDDYTTDPTIINRTILHLLYDLRRDHKLFVEGVRPVVKAYREHLVFMADKKNCNEETFEKYNSFIRRLMKYKSTGDTLIRNMKDFKEHISKQPKDHFTDKALVFFHNIRKEFIELYQPIYNLTSPQ